LAGPVQDLPDISCPVNQRATVYRLDYINYNRLICAFEGRSKALTDARIESTAHLKQTHASHISSWTVG
jgi:hypothetical protein